jgi:hypothetical protein
MMFAASPALRPFFYSRFANQPVRLFRGAASIAGGGGRRFSSDASVRLRWLPNSRVEVDITEAQFPFGLGDDKAVIKFPSAIADTPLLISSIADSVVAFLIHPVELGDPSRVRGIKFHVPNFLEYHGTAISRGSERGGKTWSGRTELKGMGWRITLDSVHHLKRLQDSIAKHGGVGLTHIGLLEREDRGEFHAKDGMKVLEAVNFLFSFARGAWTTCTLPVGIGEDGSARWASWYPPRVSTASPLSWFSKVHPQALGELLPGVLEKAADATWWDAITLALNWYYEANEAGGMIYTSLVLQQNALELLAWTLLVEKGPLSEDGFDKLWASDKIRLLLDRVGVRLEIPAQLAALASFGKSKNLEDGPHALTMLRNGFVHPKRLKKLGAVPPNCYSQAWTLGLWYLELCFLWLFDYSGEYYSRLDAPKIAGKSERVPWAT